MVKNEYPQTTTETPESTLKHGVRLTQSSWGRGTAPDTGDVQTSLSALSLLYGRAPTEVGFSHFFPLIQSQPSLLSIHCYRELSQALRKQIPAWRTDSHTTKYKCTPDLTTIRRPKPRAMSKRTRERANQGGGAEEETCISCLIPPKTGGSLKDAGGVGGPTGRGRAGTDKGEQYELCAKDISVL